MTVRELIATLEVMPQDAEVLVLSRRPEESEIDYIELDRPYESEVHIYSK